MIVPLLAEVEGVFNSQNSATTGSPDVYVHVEN
jgi:hypothetical protein